MLSKTRPRLAIMAPVAVVWGLLFAVQPDVTSAEVTAAGPADAPRAVRPNVVVFLTDDMRADELRHMPTVRQLAAGGMTFPNARSSDSLCCPARATLLTGELAHNHKTIGNEPEGFGGYQWFKEHNDLQNLLPEWLRSRGYNSAWIGKYLNGFGGPVDARQPDWTFFAAPVDDAYRYRRNVFAVNGDRLDPVIEYREFYQRRLLLRRLTAFSRRDRPFFVLYTSLAPHSGYTDTGWRGPEPEAKYAGTVPLGSLQEPPSTRDRLGDNPQWVRDYAAESPTHFSRRLEARRIESLRSVDDTVARAVNRLRRTGESRNTIFVFTSDNGHMLGEHKLGGKNKPYHESVSIPLAVWGPGFPRGRPIAEVNLTDVTSTVMQAAGDGGAVGDGIALQRVVARPKAFGRRPTLIEGGLGQIGSPHVWPVDRLGRFYWGVTWRGHTYVEYASGEAELYNRHVDPYQMSNKYRPRPAPGGMQATMKAWLDGHTSCAGAACNHRLGIPSG